MDSIPNSEAKRPGAQAIDGQEGRSPCHVQKQWREQKQQRAKRNGIDEACKGCAACYCCSNPTSRNLNARMHACERLELIGSISLCIFLGKRNFFLPHRLFQRMGRSGSLSLVSRNQ